MKDRLRSSAKCAVPQDDRFTLQGKGAESESEFYHRGHRERAGQLAREG
jgi:hypothetical protein